MRQVAILTVILLSLSATVHAEEVQPVATPTKSTLISPAQAAIIGLVEGITEFLPVSSTGHLILTDQLLGLRDRTKLSDDEYDAIEAYEIVVQSGAILAVLFLYGTQVLLMLKGLVGRSAVGRKLLINVVSAFVPTAVIGLLLHSIIKNYLQDIWPVIFALAVGGVGMIWFERSAFAKRVRQQGGGIESLTPLNAAKIGLWQCLAMWPGTSRSMTTIVGGMTVGLSPVAAAEFSFILGLPTLLAATLLKIVKDSHVLITHIGSIPMLIGLVVAAFSAAIAVRSFVHYLTRRGLAPFGWYRIALAVVMLGYFGLS